jgi:DNA-binding NtrC family response regulator
MRVLLLEDEPSQQQVLGATLTLMDFNVLPASDVEEALRTLGADFDAAILDVRVPDPAGLQRDGLTVLTALRERHAELPVAIFTGVELSPADMELVQRYRATVFYKPLPYATLIDFLERVQLSNRPA